MPDCDKLVFEVSWEVVNKGHFFCLLLAVGGIHTVIRTKAEETVRELQDSYFMIGPYNPHEAITEVESCAPFLPEIEYVIECMRNNGIKVIIGSWSIPGNPNVILFDILSGYGHIDGWRHELHSHTTIPFNVFDKEISDCIVFGGLVSWFLGDLRNRLGHNFVMLSHFHEWNSSIGLIFLRFRNFDIGLIFTTHATLMGRHISSGGCDLYNNLKQFDCDFESGKRGFYTNHCIERCAAHKAHVFTTVSSITAEEAEAFLHRHPGKDVITPNGLYINNYIALHEFQNLHVVCKEIIHEFVRGHFFGSYYFDLDKTIYLFNAGRYEYTNKGVDILLEAAYRLNNVIKVRARNLDVTVVLFLIFNAKTNNYNVESLKNQVMVRQLKKSVEQIQKTIGERIFDSVIRGHIPNPNELMHPKEITELKKFLHSCRSGTNLPPIVTHNMLDDDTDPILSALRQFKLFNSVDDRVKVIFHPKFLSSTSPLFPIDYENFVRGCHMGIFPSYYEPWGYTPAECTILGIPSMTTNLSGFGQFMEDHINHPTDYGIYIIDRRTKSLEESITQITTVFSVERTHPDKLRFFKQFDDSCLRIPKIERTLSMASPRHSEYSSEDEHPHLWGTADSNPFNLDNFENL
ncbi:hypothetical protein HZS_2530, partial [Henneguya salminicola]